MYTIGRRIDYNIWYIKYICYPWAKLQFLVLSRFRELLGKRSRGRCCCRCRAVVIPWPLLRKIPAFMLFVSTTRFQTTRTIYASIAYFFDFSFFSQCINGLHMSCAPKTHTHTYILTHTHTKLHSKIGQIRAIRGEYKLVRFVALGLRWWFIWCAMQFHVNCYWIIYLCAHVFCGLHIFNGNSETVCQNRIHYFGSQLGQILKAEPA